MIAGWSPKDTTTHQDHVIAHVLGAAILGHFIFDEALYILLDIGFVWTIFLDGEMSLLPHPVAIKELEINAAAKQELLADIDLLLSSNPIKENLLRFKLPLGDLLTDDYRIADVSFFELGEQRRLVLACEGVNLVIETSLTTREIEVTTNSKENEASETNRKLEEVAETEHQYLHQRLREELGREPTEEELDEWLRQHTEGY